MRSPRLPRSLTPAKPTPMIAVGDDDDGHSDNSFSPPNSKDAVVRWPPRRHAQPSQISVRQRRVHNWSGQRDRAGGPHFRMRCRDRSRWSSRDCLSDNVCGGQQHAATSRLCTQGTYGGHAQDASQRQCLKQAGRMKVEGNGRVPPEDGQTENTNVR